MNDTNKDLPGQELQLGEPQREIAPAQTMSPLVTMALEKDFDLDKLDKLLDIQLRFEANEARKAYHQAVAAFKAVAPAIKKNKNVSFQTGKGETNYNHATLGYALSQVTPLLSEHGLSLTFGLDQEGARITVTAILTHCLGHDERTSLSEVADQSGGKNNIQATASTVTYLQRYTGLAILGLASVDDDDGAGASSEPISMDQFNEIQQFMDGTGWDTVALAASICEENGVDGLMQLPASKFKVVCANLRVSGGNKK